MTVMAAVVWGRFCADSIPQKVLSGKMAGHLGENSLKNSGGAIPSQTVMGCSQF
jgi:hypothetical protein